MATKIESYTAQRLHKMEEESKLRLEAMTPSADLTREDFALLHAQNKEILSNAMSAESQQSGELA